MTPTSHPDRPPRLPGMMLFAMVCGCRTTYHRMPEGASPTSEMKVSLAMLRLAGCRCQRVGWGRVDRPPAADPAGPGRVVMTEAER